MAQPYKSQIEDKIHKQIDHKFDTNLKIMTTPMQNTPKTIEERVEEFRQKAYPVVHSNAFPEKDFIYLEELCNYFRKAISEQDRISRESERERISKRLDKLTRYGTTIHTTPPNFWAYKCEDVEDLLQTNKE